MEVNLKFSDTQEITNVPYQELIGSLMYLSVSTRPDISFAISFLSQFNLHHTNEHWQAAKRVLRYLKATQDVGLLYKQTRQDIAGFVDADWANDPTDRKSFTGYVFKLADNAISWECRKQTSTALSSTEAEYMALSEASKEAVYLNGLLIELCSTYDKAVEIFSENQSIDLFNDNQSAQKIATNPIFHRRTKHVDVRYHHLREKIAEGKINLHYLSTQQMIADVCTKALPGPKHKLCSKGIGLK